MPVFSNRNPDLDSCNGCEEHCVFDATFSYDILINKYWPTIGGRKIESEQIFLHAGATEYEHACARQRAISRAREISKTCDNYKKR